MPNTALITGASGGIGRALADYHASKGGDLIIVARRTDVLEAAKAEIEAAHGVSVHVIAQDLGTQDGAEAVIKSVADAGLQVDILINNAGFGGLGTHTDRPLADELAMVDLNIKALVTLTHAFAGQMAKRGAGKILQVGSTAGFLPGPNHAVYYATKAFVGSYSQSLDHELRGSGVTCTLLAPGYVETDFADRADMHDIELTKSGAAPESVAKCGYDAMMAGRLVAINDRKLRFMLGWLIPFMPRRMVLNMIANLQSK